MADRLKIYCVEEVVNFCPQTDESDIDSSCRAMSSDEENGLDRPLLGNSDINSEKRLFFYVFSHQFFFLDKKNCNPHYMYLQSWSK